MHVLRQLRGHDSGFCLQLAERLQTRLLISVLSRHLKNYAQLLPGACYCMFNWQLSNCWPQISICPLEAENSAFSIPADVALSISACWHSGHRALQYNVQHVHRALSGSLLT